MAHRTVIQDIIFGCDSGVRSLCKEQPMPAFFPHQTVEWKLEEPRAFRRFSYSLVEMALVTGVVLRLYRSVALTHGANSWLYLGGTFAVGLLVLLLMTTAHLANYPVQRWVWRAPLFAVVEVAGAMATSLLLIAVGREPNGTVRAVWSDWPAMAGSALVSHTAAILLWALVLAGVVVLVRRTVVHQDEPEDEDETAAKTA
jgi:hypothetical protein